jgi:hypothetical protein
MSAKGMRRTARNAARNAYEVVGPRCGGELQAEGW